MLNQAKRIRICGDVVATDSQDAFHARRWGNFAGRLEAALKEIGLRADEDYWFHQRRGLDPSNLIELQSVDQVTPDVLVACANATWHDPTWNVVIAVQDQSAGKPDFVVHTNGGVFTFLGGGDRVSEAIHEAMRRRGGPGGWFKE